MIYYVIFLMCFIVALLSLGYLISFKQYQKRQSYILNFEKYEKVLDEHLLRAFNIIYKDRIFLYSVEGTKPDEKDQTKATKDFCKLFIELIGTTMYREFCYLYGSEDSFMLNIVEYFNTKTETDEIKDAAIDRMVGDSDEAI